jgi:hypothetical protein
MEGFVMSKSDERGGEKDPQRRLLEAMVTLNAINNGRPIPDMKNIVGGWVFKVTPEMDREDIRAGIEKATQTPIAQHKQ